MADEADSDDKQLDPTQKRLDEALERGDVVKSQEINTWFIIAGGTLVMSTFGGSIGSGILVPMRNLIANSWMIRTDGRGLLELAQHIEYALIVAIGVPFLMLMLAAIAGNMIQHRLVWSAESLKPKLSKISPGAGFKRIFGKQAAANFLKGLFKLIALGAVMTAVLWPERHRLEAMVRLDPAAIIAYSRLRASDISPGPSARIIQELAIRLRSGSSRPPPIEPEKVDMISVPPAITNQVLTSWLLATSPRSSASSRRFCDGSNVLSESSPSSAMV